MAPTTRRPRTVRRIHREDRAAADSPPPDPDLVRFVEALVVAAARRDHEAAMEGKIVTEFAEVERQCDQVKSTSEALVSECAPAIARQLIDLCQSMRPRLRGPYGNVREKLAEVIDAATLFTKARVDVGLAVDTLVRAVGKMEIALEMHRHRGFD